MESVVEGGKRSPTESSSFRRRKFQSNDAGGQYSQDYNEQNHGEKIKEHERMSKGIREEKESRSASFWWQRKRQTMRNSSQEDGKTVGARENFIGFVERGISMICFPSSSPPSPQPCPFPSRTSSRKDEQLEEDKIEKDIRQSKPLRKQVDKLHTEAHSMLCRIDAKIQAKTRRDRVRVFEETPTTTREQEKNALEATRRENRIKAEREKIDRDMRKGKELVRQRVLGNEEQRRRDDAVSFLDDCQ
jgi:hypothetical protein